VEVCYQGQVDHLLEVHDRASGMFYREIIADRAFAAMRGLLAEALA
jgi:hypothetical protein